MIKRLAWFWIFICIFTACSEKPKLPFLHPDAKILAFGDSLTAGMGAPSGSDYPSLLERMIRREVINGGAVGELSDEGLIRLPQWLDRYRPALLILCHGGTDLLMQRDQVRVANNIRRMIQLARDRGTSVILIGVPQPVETSLNVVPFYYEIASDFAIPYEGKVLRRILTDQTLKSNQLHANKEGYETLARAVAKLLKDSGALEQTAL